MWKDRPFRAGRGAHLAITVLLLLTALPLGASLGADADTLQIPAGTAYFQPDIEPPGTDVSAKDGITGWTDAKNSVVWYGQLGAGRLTPALTLRLPAGTKSTLKLTVGREARTADAVGGDGPSTVSFGDVTIPKAGEYRLVLSGVSKTGTTFGDLQTLMLTGTAVNGAHFSQAVTRGAPSVHLFYKTPKDAPIAWFYNEVTAKADPIDSYYMACGFSRGYFGIQVNSPTERRIIFSVWDSGKEPTDRTKVGADDLVQLLGKGLGVYTSGFGNEGTGGHSHLVYPWKTGQTYRLLVSAQPDGTGTIYSGYFYFPERKAWGLIASFRAPKDGNTLRGLYSFNEDFNGANGFAPRRAEFGPAWIRTADGQWTPLTQATFSHTADGKSERLDRSSGVIGDRFFLSNGGFTPPSSVKYGDLFTRPASGHPPTDAELPSPPRAVPTVEPHSP